MGAEVSGLGAFFIVVAVVAVISCVGILIYTHLRARRLGLPTPTLSSYNPFQSRSSGSFNSGGGGGVGGWIKDKISGFKNRNNRSAGGAYEEPLSSNVRGRASNRGFGPLDPDDAWDARVGTEADAYGPGGYYEEQELGLHGGEHANMAPTPGLAPAGYGDPPRGRSLSRDAPEPYIGGTREGLNRRYDEEMGVRPAVNPFDDAAELGGTSLRGVSPRPIETSMGNKAKDGTAGHSPTEQTERRSLFREEM